MGIGDKVRAAQEEKQEQELNAKGELSGRQLRELVGRGFGIADARSLAQAGISFDDILSIADMQAEQRAKAVGQSDVALLAQQNREFMEKVIEKARTRRPESYNGDFPFPNISAFNPDGSAKPAPPLKCDMYEGKWAMNPRTRVIDYQDGYPLEQGDDGLGPLTKQEVRLLNQLTAGEFQVENNSDETGLVRIVVHENDATGAPVKLVIAYPEPWMTNEGKGLKPSVTKLCRQVLGIEGNVNAWLDQREGATAAA